MIDENNFNALVGALRKHPKCKALSVWTDEDISDWSDEENDFVQRDSSHIPWGYFEDRLSEMGYEILSNIDDKQEV